MNIQKRAGWVISVGLILWAVILSGGCGDDGGGGNGDSGNNCDDNIPCTIDYYDTTTWSCQHIPDDSLCGAGEYCSCALGCRVPKTWTILVYLDGDNNLEGAAIDDFNEMEVVGSQDNFDIVVQIDRMPFEDFSNGNWSGTRRYYVVQDTDPYIINSTLVSDLGEVNMGDQATLQDFVQWGIMNFRSSKNALILWNHGSGWKLKIQNSLKGVAWDDSSGSDYLTNGELDSALWNARVNTGLASLDLVGFDACLMQMTEVAHYLSDDAHVMVGSEESEPGDGWPYDLWLAELAANPTMDGATLGEKIVETYYSYPDIYNSTLSAVDLSYGNSLAAAVDSFAQSLIDSYPTDSSTIDTARINTMQFYDSDYVDLYHFAELISLDTTLPGTLILDAQTVMAALDAAVIINRTKSGYADSHGLSIYYPACSVLPYYSDLSFAQNTRWDEYISGALVCGDPYEPNDASESAYNLAEQTWLTSISGLGAVMYMDYDFFRIDVSPGEERVQITCAFTHANGDIDIQLRDSSMNFLDDSDSSTDNESINYVVSSPGTYYIIVYRYDYQIPSCNTYDLVWDDVPP